MKHILIILAFSVVSSYGFGKSNQVTSKPELAILADENGQWGYYKSENGILKTMSLADFVNGFEGLKNKAIDAICKLKQKPKTMSISLPGISLAWDVNESMCK